MHGHSKLLVVLWLGLLVQVRIRARDEKWILFRRKIADVLCVNDLLTVATVNKSLTLSLIHSTSAILQMSPTVSKSPVPFSTRTSISGGMAVEFWVRNCNGYGCRE